MSAASLLSAWQDLGKPTSVQEVSVAAANAAAVKLTPSVESTNRMVRFVTDLRTMWHILPANFVLDLVIAGLLVGIMLWILSLCLRRIGGLGWIIAQISLFILAIIIVGWVLLTLVVEANFIGFVAPTPVPTVAPQVESSWLAWMYGAGEQSTMSTTITRFNANE
jgi:hypothetical protein